jgi:hypothetical protein
MFIKKWGFITLCILVSNGVLAQSNVELDTVYKLNANFFWQKNLQLQKTNMYVLASWAGVNIIQSAIGTTNATGSSEHFFRMNIYWNVVNAGVAAAGLYGVKKKIAKQISLTEIYTEQQKLEKILLFNTGLDVGYVFAGLYLNEKGKRTNNLQSQGFGNSLLLQGSFLLVFDVIQYFLYRQQGKQVDNLFKNAAFTVNNNGIGLVYRL